MKITLHGPSFLNIAKTVTRGLGVKDQQSQTLFQIIDLDTEQPKLLMKCRSQTTFFKGVVNISNIESTADETKEWGVDGNQLKTILSVLSTADSSIEFNMSDTNRLFVVSNVGNTFKLPVYDAPQFSNEEEITILAEVDATEFSENTANLSKLTLSNNAIQEHPLSCLHYFFSEDTLTFVASNVLAFTEFKQVAHKVSANKAILLKPLQANLLLSNFTANTVLTLVESKTMFGYIDDLENLCLVSKADIKPLNYQQIIQRVSEDSTIEIKRDNFKYAIDSLSKLCVSSDILTFKVNSNGILSIYNDNKDVINISFDGDVQETEMTILKPALNILLGILTNTIRLSWGNETSKRIVKITLLDDNGNTLDDKFICAITNDR